MTRLYQLGSVKWCRWPDSFAFSPMAKIKVSLRQAVASNSPLDCCDTKFKAGTNIKTKRQPPVKGDCLFVGAGGRTRTGTMSPSVDFESTTSTNSITPADVIIFSDHRPMPTIFYKVAACGGLCRPRLRCPPNVLGVNACVPRRPLHLLHPRFIRHRRRSGSQQWF